MLLKPPSGPKGSAKRSFGSGACKASGYKRRAQVYRRNRSVNLRFGFVLALALSCFSTLSALASPPVPEPEPEPQPIDSDRLAFPVLPENPTQIDLGSYSYYYNCMPCHGDKGQGLTEEFRNIWVEDHRNCWASHCHGGHVGDEGFPIPKYIPGVKDLSRFTDEQALFIFLKTTHPPQEPGRLSDDDYWSLTAFLLYQAGRLSSGEYIGPEKNSFDIQTTLLALAAQALVLIFLPGLLASQANKSDPRRHHVFP
jgi:hypothetical protein